MVLAVANVCVAAAVLAQANCVILHADVHLDLVRQPRGLREIAVLDAALYFFILVLLIFTAYRYRTRMWYVPGNHSKRIKPVLPGDHRPPMSRMHILYLNLVVSFLAFSLLEMSAKFLQGIGWTSSETGTASIAAAHVGASLAKFEAVAQLIILAWFVRSQTVEHSEHLQSLVDRYIDEEADVDYTRVEPRPSIWSSHTYYAGPELPSNLNLVKVGSLTHPGHGRRDLGTSPNIDDIEFSSL